MVPALVDSNLGSESCHEVAKEATRFIYKTMEVMEDISEEITKIVNFLSMYFIILD